MAKVLNDPSLHVEAQTVDLTLDPEGSLGINRQDVEELARHVRG